MFWGLHTKYIYFFLNGNHTHTPDLEQYLTTEWLNAVFLLTVIDHLEVCTFSFLDLDLERMLKCWATSLVSSVWQVFIPCFWCTKERSSTPTGQLSDCKEVICRLQFFFSQWQKEKLCLQLHYPFGSSSLFIFPSSKFSWSFYTSRPTKCYCLPIPVTLSLPMVTLCIVKDGFQVNEEWEETMRKGKGMTLSS